MKIELYRHEVVLIIDGLNLLNSQLNELCGLESIKNKIEELEILKNKIHQVEYGY